MFGSMHTICSTEMCDLTMLKLYLTLPIGMMSERDWLKLGCQLNKVSAVENLQNNFHGQIIL